MKIELGLATSGIARDYFHRLFLSHFSYFFSHLSFITMIFRERLYTSRNIYSKISLSRTFNKVESFSLNEKMRLFCNWKI